MKVLALDQALKVTGYAIFNNGKSLIEHGAFPVSPQKAMHKRLLDILSHLNELYAQHEFEKIYLKIFSYKQGMF